MEIVPDKAQYRPNEAVCLTACLAAPASTPVAVSATVFELEQPVATLTATVPAGESSAALRWQAPAGRSHAAYGVIATAGDATATTAFDVADAWWHAPRLGFLTDFSAGETLSETQRRLATLARLHVNCLYFYDWMYAHYQYLPPEPVFVDPMGRELALPTLRRKVRAAHALGMAALAYAPAYVAENAFARAHPEWCLYRGDGEPFNVARLFYIMDFRPGTPWQEWILREYATAVAEVGFDGVQIDQYGYPKKALSYPGRLGDPALDLAKLFLPFIRAADAAVRAVNPAARVVFHATNNWPLREVAAGPQVFNYIPVFGPHLTYRDLRDLVAGARLLTPQKPVVLGAYLKPFRAGPSAGALAALRLLMAAVHGGGGYLLALGEGDGVLTEGYFPNYVRLGEAGLAVIRPYCDFIVRFGPLLTAPPEEDVSETQAGGVTPHYTLHGVPASPAAQPGTVWLTIREHPGLSSVQLINLLGSDGVWDRPQAEPPRLTDLHLSAHVLQPVASVLWASPDADGVTLRPVPFRVEHDPRVGYVLHCTIPELRYWDLVLIRWESRG